MGDQRLRRVSQLPADARWLPVKILALASLLGRRGRLIVWWPRTFMPGSKCLKALMDLGENILCYPQKETANSCESRRWLARGLLNINKTVESIMQAVSMNPGLSDFLRERVELESLGPGLGRGVTGVGTVSRRSTNT